MSPAAAFAIEAQWESLRQEMREQVLRVEYFKALARTIGYGKLEIEFAEGQIKRVSFSPSVRMVE